MATIETLHHKFITKLNILENAGYYLQDVVKNYENTFADTEIINKPKNKTMTYTKYMEYVLNENVKNGDIIDKYIIEIARIKTIYNAGASPLLSIYYDDTFKTSSFLENDETSKDFNEKQNQQINEKQNQKPNEKQNQKINEKQNQKSNEKPKETNETNLYTSYNTFVMSENILDKMDHIMNKINDIVKVFHKTKAFRDFISSPTQVDSLDDLAYKLMMLSDVENTKSYTDFFTVFQRYLDEYDQNKLVLTIKKDITNICSCGGLMTILPDTSELRCEECGMMITLEGTVFEDSQFYTQQGQCTKHKKYDAKRHCKKWLDQIQAKENKSFPQELIDALNARARMYYMRNGKLRSMSRMKCSQIREWLKDEGETDYNPHAPLLRKMITSENGNAVIPPQLKYDEEQRILVLFSQAMDVYDQIMEEKLTLVTNNRRPNKPYYPYVLFKILHIVLKNNVRLNGLIECIHLQSDGTLKNHDTIWRKICDEMTDEKDFVYKPTDRTILLDVF